MPSQHQNPSVAFAHVESVSPIVDVDALREVDSSMQERALHEAGLMNEFIQAFRGSKECEGIDFFNTANADPAFTLHIGVRGHDRPGRKQSWTWILAYPGDPSTPDTEGHGSGGMGSQPNAQLTARDVCVTVWSLTGLNRTTKPHFRP